jgi:hypothetical protein
MDVGRLEHVVRSRSTATMMLAGGAILPVWFDRPDWHNGFEHAPNVAARMRLYLLGPVAVVDRTNADNSLTSGWCRFC